MTLAADRLKNAAATKKLAIFDAFEILKSIEDEKLLLEGNEVKSQMFQKDLQNQDQNRLYVLLKDYSKKCFVS